MKLAEALMIRADLQTRINELRNRMTSNAIVQEGQAPAEDPMGLLREFEQLTNRLADMVRKINRTNIAVELEAGITLADALATRDMLQLRQKTYQDIATSGTMQYQRFMHSQVKFQGVIDVPAIRKLADEAARQYRELDARIQAANWTNDLIE